MTEFSTAAFVAYLYAEGFEFLKRWKAFRWVTARSVGMNRAIAIASSFFLALGVHASYASEEGVLTVTGLTVWSIGSHLVEWLRQYMMQRFFYRNAVKGF